MSCWMSSHFYYVLRSALHIIAKVMNIESAVNFLAYRSVDEDEVVVGLCAIARNEIEWPSLCNPGAAVCSYARILSGDQSVPGCCFICAVVS